VPDTALQRLRDGVDGTRVVFTASTGVR
jgi:hypothetical protein